LASQRPNGIFVGVNPFMLLAVRVRWALSAKPAACAAAVAVAPSAKHADLLPEDVMQTAFRKVHHAGQRCDLRGRRGASRR